MQIVAAFFLSSFKMFIALLPFALFPLLISSHPSPPTCAVNTLTAYQTTSAPVTIDTSPLDPFESVKLSAINSTAWEYWYYDAVSSDGTSGVAITFFRDPSLSSYGLGILRVEVDAVWSNGTQYTTTLFVNESTVTTCPDTTYGKWNMSDEGIDCSFKISSDLRTSSIKVAGPGVSGTFEIESFAPPRYPDGGIYPDAHSSLALAPLTYWNEAIPAGRVTSSLVLNNTPFQLTGIGGHDRNFAPYIWDYLATHWYWIRAVTGPYAVVFWTFTSAIDGVTYVSAFLSEDGVEIFASRIGTPGDMGGYATLQLTYGGEVHGSFADQSTGFVIEMVEEEKDGCEGRKWSFGIEHKNAAFEAPQGSNDAYSRFVNTASGGLVGGEVWTGAANSEQNVILVNPPLATTG